MYSPTIKFNVDYRLYATANSQKIMAER